MAAGRDRRGLTERPRRPCKQAHGEPEPISGEAALPRALDRRRSGAPSVARNRMKLTVGVLLACACMAVAAQDARRAAAPPFADRTAEVGVDFIHVNGATGELLLPEVIGAGGALFDYDNDGDLDLFAVQSGPLRRGAAGGGTLSRSRLFRNDLSGAGRLHFTDVTERSGIMATGYGMGAAVGDIDNDGWADLYLTGLGAAQMLRNNGNGTFSDVTA